MLTIYKKYNNMKRSLLFLFVVLLVAAVGAQSSQTLLNEMTSRFKSKSVNFWDHNKKRGSQGVEYKNLNAETLNPVKRNNEIKPSNTIFGNWGVYYNVETEKESFFLFESEEYDMIYHSNLEMSPLDDNMEKITTFKLDLPTYTNGYRIEYDMKSSYFALHTHSFEGSVGPDNQRDSVWFISHTGEIVEKFGATGAAILKNGNVLLMQENTQNADYIILDGNTFEEKKKISLDVSLITMMQSFPLSIQEINGKEYILVSHYEKILMDNSTMEVTPDNHFVLKLYDTETTELINEIKYPLPTVDEFLLIPMAGFGLFDYEYDITQQVFNDDDKYEFIIGIVYYNIPNDRQWINYVILDESGNVIKSYDKDVYDSKFLSSIEGHADQMAFLLYDESDKPTMQIFNIKDWTEDTAFDLIREGVTLAAEPAFYDRIEKGDSYEYMFAATQASAFKDENGFWNCIVKSFNKDGVETNTYNLQVSDGNFAYYYILIDNSLLNPHLFNTDDDYEFFFSYQGLTPEGKFDKVHYKIAASNKPAMLDFTYTEEYGDPFGGSFMYDPHTLLPTKLYIKYRNGTTEFYNLPLRSGTDNITSQKEIKQSVYYNNVLKEISLDADIKQAEIYNSSGYLIYKGNAKKISTIGFAKGLYVVKTISVNGEVVYNKIMAN